MRAPTPISPTRCSPCAFSLQALKAQAEGLWDDVRPIFCNSYTGRVAAGAASGLLQHWNCCRTVPCLPKSKSADPVACSFGGGHLDKIMVNFDAGLVAMLRETRYFQLVATQLPSSLPELATKVRMIIDTSCSFETVTMWRIFGLRSQTS